MTEPVMVGGATPAESGTKRLAILGGAAAALLLLALVLPKVLFGGDDLAVDDLSSVPVATAGATTTTALPVEDAELDGAEADPASTFEVFSTKNPFTPLRDLTPATATGAPSAGDPLTDPTAAPGTPVAGTDPLTTTPTTQPSTLAPVGGVVAPVASTTPTTVVRSTEPISGQRVALLEVFVDDGDRTVASVRVNDTVHQVAAGAAFAGRYQAVTLSVADGCGQFLYGDASFRLCEGEELLK